MKDAQITLEDGRTLAYKEIGDADGTPVMHFHGAPSCRTFLDYLHDEFADRNLRVISPDRPGYGGTSPQPSRSLDDWSHDVIALADTIDVDQFGVIGFSSGGPYAAATCALVPARVFGGVVVAGPSDPSQSGTLDGLPEVEQELMAQPDEEAAVEWCTSRFGSDGSRFGESDPFDWSQPDEAFLADDTISTHFEEVSAEALRQGISGYAQDIFVQGRPWPFDPSRIDVPVHVVHGEEDEIVSVAHSRRIADAIPTAMLKQLPEHGHLSIINKFPELVADLVASTN